MNYYEKSLELSTEIGYEWLISISTHNIGAVKQKQERHKLAIANFQHSLELSFELGDARRAVRTIQTIVDVYIAEGKLEAATQLLSFVQAFKNRGNTDIESSDFIHFQQLLDTIREKCTIQFLISIGRLDSF